MIPEAIVRDLNAEQRRAVETVRGPVCILAGAGSGKTTTITRRIAAQVAVRAFRPNAILAVTFTDKAAGEMRSRLEMLGVEGVRARTFHSAAAAQLHHLASTPPGRILPTKAVALAALARALPKPYRFRPAGDLATEIEWAKNRRIPLDRYADSLGAHRPPIPPDLMTGVWRRYEEGKRQRGLVDFEDLLELAVRMFEEDVDALERLQARYHAFTVDEYQDVNLLQQTLLERWVGERDDLCVVGDDHQSIYSFTGASPEPLLRMPSMWARTKVIKLETNYRSTPQVLDVANKLAPSLGGRTKKLRALGAAGPPVERRGFGSAADEIAHLVRRVETLHRRDEIAFEDMAVLYRANHRSEDYEEALSGAEVPFVVREGGFLQRPAARRLLAAFRRSGHVDVARRVRAAAERDGWSEDAGDGVGERELTRQRDLARLVRLAQELDDGNRTLAAFVAAVEERFGAQGEARGVNLLTLHRSK
ncbi:MAG TPA: ATP-dependent helicase, partial [Actinomycetota bacterium]|nr:ATP-dependent helicase [Actinomycetota bacterium]